MIEDRIYEVFRSALLLDESADRTALEYNRTEHWDSLGHMNIVTGLEQEFDCMLEPEEVLDMSSFRRAVEIMEKYA